VQSKGETMRKSSGFTLLEVLITVIIGAILTTMMFSWMSVASSYQERSYRESVRQDNQAIARALRNYAGVENKGFLPSPFTGGLYQNAPVDVTNARLIEFLAQGQVSAARYNQDDSSAQNVKYYELINPKPTYCMPIVGSSSECVTLVYDRAILTQTTCSITDTCNDGTPGASGSYTLAGWFVTPPDLAPVEISTLDIQQSLWRSTWLRLNETRLKIRNAFNATVASSTAGATDNFFFKPNLAGSPDLSGSDPTTNQGCRDGWYQLDSIDVNVLSFYGLEPQSVYGVTAWGGRIEYCQDFDPADTGANVLPHIAAIRINRAVTAGQAPASTTAQNLILVI
jgi:prepilin-type N-terminal cleavage/methylation domain-containing protein